MARRVIVQHPDPVLREKAVQVRKINANVNKLLDDMLETMIDAEGIGLAAPQVGVSKRIAIVQLNEDEELIEMINPEIIEKQGEQFGPEGCLSMPNLLGEVRRYQQIKIKALNRDGNEFELDALDLLSRAIQHEIDHLNGVLFTDLAEKLYNKREWEAKSSELDHEEEE